MRVVSAARASGFAAASADSPAHNTTAAATAFASADSLASATAASSTAAALLSYEFLIERVWAVCAWRFFEKRMVNQLIFHPQFLAAHESKKLKQRTSRNQNVCYATPISVESARNWN